MLLLSFTAEVMKERYELRKLHKRIEKIIVFVGDICIAYSNSELFCLLSLYC